MRVLVLFLLLVVRSAAEAQDAGGSARALELARAGSVTESWALWSALPNGPDKARLGVEIAILGRDVRRGINLYNTLTPLTTADLALLGRLAVVTAHDLASSRDTYTAAIACSAALRMAPADGPCRALLERLAKTGANPAELALGAYGLADAGLRPLPAVFANLDRTLPASSRIQMAIQFRYVGTEDRVRLLRPVLVSGDEPARYQALLVLGSIPGDAAAAALRGTAAATGPLTIARTLGLAEHGDRPSLGAVAGMLDTLDDYLKIKAALAIALAGQARGESMLADLAAGPVDLNRMYAVEALSRVNRERAKTAALAILASASPTLRTVMIGAAGRVGLGTARQIYAELVSGDEEARAQAVIAIADTLTPAPSGATGRP